MTVVTNESAHDSIQPIFTQGNLRFHLGWEELWYHIQKILRENK